METREYKVYAWDELSDEGKDKALEKYWDININFDWYTFTQDDAKDVGIEIEEFDLYHGTIKVKALQDEVSIAESIIKNHGETCDAFIDAKVFLKEINELPDKGEDAEASKELRRDFVRTLGEDYRIMLDHEYQYLTSEAAIIESFKANEYMFTEDGEID